MMRAAVVYDSKYGCTKAVAEAIGEGLREGGLEDSKVNDVNDFFYEHIPAHELLIVGSPTHYEDATRRCKFLIGHAAPEEGERRYGVAFGTRLFRESKGAGAVLHALMEEQGIEMIMGPEDFMVEMKAGPLSEGELERARAFGASIAAKALES